MTPTAKETTPSDKEHPHYPWGASAAKTWRNCPGSINYVADQVAKKRIVDVGSSYSDEGTKAHDWADKCLRGEITRDQIPGEFLEHLAGYLDLAEDLAGENGGTVYHEQKVPLFYNTAEVGTLDYAVWSRNRVDILDLKYGEGVEVLAEDNDQLAIYAISLVNLVEKVPKMDTVFRLHIYQPRHRNFDGLPQVWETTWRELLDLSIDIQADYKRSKVADITDLRPSRCACEEGFCKARHGNCVVRALNLWEEVPDELNPFKGEPNPDALTEIPDEVRVRVFEKGKEIAKWLEKLNDDTVTLIENGTHVAGLKTVDGNRGNRTFTGNEEEAAKLLREIPVERRFKPRRVITPAQAEKELKKLGKPIDKQSTRFQNRWRQLIVQSDGKPALALESDPKPARIRGPEQFDEVPDEKEIDENDIF